MFGSIGMPELIIILVIALIIFGPRKLPELGKSLGRSLNEFKKASTDLQNTLEQEIKIEEQKEAADKFKVDENKFKKTDDHAAPPHTVTPGPGSDGQAIRTTRRRKRCRAARHPRHRTHGTRSHGFSSFSFSESRRRAAESSGEAGRLFAVRRSRRGARRRPDDVPRASRRAAQAHHARRRRVARRLHSRVRVHQSRLRCDFIYARLASTCPAAR